MSTVGTPLDVVRDALVAAGCDPKGNQRITAKCPAHDDSSPSLSVRRGTTQAVVFKCHANCRPDDVVEALGLKWSDLYEDDDYEPPTEPVTKRIEATYRYVDEHDMHLFDVVRFDPKDFRQRRADGKWTIAGVRRVLYRLPAVIEAVSAGMTVYICEGEKDVHALEQAGAVATCNSGGAGKWRDEYDNHLAGADVIVVADDDETGHRHAIAVATSVGRVARVRTVLPVQGAKDVAQHLGMGRTLDELRPFTERNADEPTDQWEPPIPFGHQGKVPLFPAHRFPPWLNTYVCAVALATQTPVDLAGVLSLSVLAGACGGRVQVEIRDGWREPTNIYTATAMSPGSRKTPVYMRLVKPLHDAEKALIERAGPKVMEARVAKAVADAAAEKAITEATKAKEESRAEAMNFAAAMAEAASVLDVPVVPRLLVDDATPEALTSLLAEHDGRLAMFSDEGDVFSMMAGRYANRGPNLAVYLKGHVGSPLRVDRKGRTAEIIDCPALTLGLTVQPAVLMSLSGIEGGRGRGLLGRFLWSCPWNNVGTRQVAADAVPEDVEATYCAEVQLIVDSLDGWRSDDQLPISMTTEADHLLRRFEEELEPQLAETGALGHIADWASKLAGHTARIAGLLHVATHVRSGFAKTAIDESIVADAIIIARYFIAHALFAFDVMEANPVMSDARAVLGWVARRKTFSRRELHKAYQGRFEVVANVKPVLELLCDHDFIREMPPKPATGRGRPPGPQYAVNPLISGETV